MARRSKTAVIYDIKKRTYGQSGKDRYIVRWRVIDRPGTPPSRSFGDERDAVKFYDQLEEASVDRERFDLVTGLPVSMLEEDDVTIAQWCKTFVDREARGYVPSSRVRLGDDFVPLISRSAAAKGAGAHRGAAQGAEGLAGR
jgi:hypothetical protein